MSADVRFLLGRADAGKTASIVEALRAHRRAGERALLIVPEQYTFEAELLLADALGGLLGVQVLSFERLCERVLALHGRTRPFLSGQGYRMVIRRAIDRKRAELLVFGAAAEHAGFAEELKGIFGDCKRAGIRPDDLSALAGKLAADTPLAGKLKDIALLYRETEDYLSSRYLDADDAFNEAVRLLPESFAAGLPVYVDGLERPNRQLYRLLEALLSCAGSLTISLRCDRSGAADADLFEPDLRVLTALKDASARQGAHVEETWLPQAKPREALMRHIERNLFAYPASRFTGDASGLTIFGASGRRAEAESLAAAVLERARRGVRFREMAVIVSDMDAYASLVLRAFARRGIPAFLDRKRPLTGHAAVDAALSAVRFTANGSAADLLRYVKSGYAGVPQDDAEELELYLRRTGLRGSALTKPLTRAKPAEGAERARFAAAEPISALAEGLKGARVSEQVRALYSFLQGIGLDRGIAERAERLREAGRVAEMEEHAQVWNALVTLLDQMDAILGDLLVGRKGFLSLLEEGLGGQEIGVIPGTSDQVLVGDVVRTKSRAVKALFVVGANDGLLPRARADDALLDDRELTELRAQGAELWMSTPELSAYDRLDLYSALSKARETLYVSFTYGDAGGELSPSPLVGRLQSLYPNCAKETDIETSDALPDCRAQALTLLASDLRRYRAQGNCPPRLPALLSLLSGEEETRGLVTRMTRAGTSWMLEATIGPAAARSLYGATLPMSASRLETFNACPFRHFVTYGLGAEETREFTERAADLGSFYHAALEAFVRTAEERSLDWKKLSDEDALALLDDVLPDVIAKHNDGIFLESARLRATLFLLLEVVRQSALAILRQLRAGSFTPVGVEVRFGAGQPFPPIRLELPDGTAALVGGKIDRIDGARALGKECLRVVDYKTGGRDFDFAGVLHGLTLQLPLYLRAATMSGAVRAGLYYMPVLQPTISDAEADVESAVTGAFRLKGLSLSDPEVLRLSQTGLEGESDVLAGVKLAGEEAAGSVCSASEMDALLNAAVRKAERTLERMLDGETAAVPATRGQSKNACRYCDYNSVCRFDANVPGCAVRKLSTIRQREFFELLGGGAHDLDE